MQNYNLPLVLCGCEAWAFTLKEGHRRRLFENSVLRKMLGPKRDELTRKRKTTDMHRLTTGIRSEKCVIRRFLRCANVIECTYTNLDSIAYYRPRLYRLFLLGYKPVQHVTVLNTVGNCNTMVSTCVSIHI
jgi:hypothetical protein